MSESKVPKTDSLPNQEAELTKQAINEKQEKTADVDVDKDYEAAQQYKIGKMSKNNG
ncbi:MAG: hypothetical protein AAFQ91_19540 [Cyanobacteria bacterium J06621_15]